MKRIWSSSTVQLAGKYGEHAPMATACCNACRTCVTTNLIALAGATAASVGVAALSFARRVFARPG